MDNNAYNFYPEHNQDMNINYYEPMNSNLTNFDDNNLIDLSSLSSRACSLPTQEEGAQYDTRHNNVIKAKGARKIGLNQRGSSYESTFQAGNDQMETILDLSAIEVSSDYDSYARQNISVPKYDDISSIETDNEEDNTSTIDEVSEKRIDKALDDSIKTKIQKCSETYKAIINTISTHFVILRNLTHEPNAMALTKRALDWKVAQDLVSSIIKIVQNVPRISIKISTRDKSTQTEITYKEPPRLENKGMQITQSVPRIKVNTRSNKIYRSKDLSKEKTSNQNSNAYNNQKEQFYDNRELFPQLQMDTASAVQFSQRDNNEYNLYPEHNQDVPFNCYEPMNNNLTYLADNNLIDLSRQSSHARNLLTPEEGMQNKPRYDQVIRTKDAKKIMLYQRGPSYEFASSKMPKQDGNNTLQARSDQMQTIYDLAASEVPNEEDNYARKIISDRIVTFDDVFSFETDNNEESTSTGDKINEKYSKIDDSVMTKIQKSSETNKAIINTIFQHLSVVMLPNLAQEPNAVKSGKCVQVWKVVQNLVSSIIKIVQNGPHMSIKISTSVKSTQTETIYKEPPFLENNGTKTVTQAVSRTKMNTGLNKIHSSKNLSKEQDVQHLQNLQASNQYSNVYNNQQEQFYGNQELFRQLQVDTDYAVQRRTHAFPANQKRERQQSKNLNKEQDVQHFQNSQATNQYSNVYNNQQEQFYDNQELFPQLQVGTDYAVQCRTHAFPANRKCERQQSKNLSKEQDVRHFQNLQASNKYSNVYNNQQEQFYDNQDLFPQLQVDADYAVQINNPSRNNVQPQIMQYGIPHPANAMMQIAEGGMSRVQQATQPGIPQHDPQRANGSRNMQRMLPRKSRRGKPRITATVHPTYYNRQKSTNVSRYETPTTDTLMMQPVPRAIPSQVCGRVSHSRDYYANATNSPYPGCAQWPMPGYQYQFQ